MTINRLAVKLGDLSFSSIFALLEVSTFSSQKRGGDNRDRTDDLLHAMHARFPLLEFLETLYLSVFPGILHCFTLALWSPVSAPECSNTRTIDGVRGGKIGVRQELNFIRICSAQIWSERLTSSLSSADSYQYLKNNIKTKSLRSPYVH